MTLLPMSILAQESENTFEKVVDDIYYIFDKDYLTATVTGCYGEMAELVIPSTVDTEDVEGTPSYEQPETMTYKVIKIADEAFKNNDDLTTVTLGDNVEVIGEWAFRGCDGITSVTLGSRVWSIGEQAFAYCTNLATVNVNNMLRSIGTHAFIGCSSLPAFNFPSTVTTIGSKKKTVNRN